ncbi:TPA: restriction endonuclease subunit S [Aeromonas veronii]|nr:restriction endonuclease subunit S [Aeromonas veronii]
MSEVVTTSQQGLAGKYKPYPEYKDSGVEWLGDIPTHWSTTVLKRLCCLTTGLTPPTSDEANYAEDGYPWVRPEDINESGSETNASKFVSNDGWQLLRKIEPNSTLICCIGTIGKCGYVRKTVSTNQQITAATFSKSGRYNYYLLQAARTQLEELATGNVLKILNTERLGALNLVKVPVEEADTIAAFLDYETARIDRLIAQQQRLIELLKEKRQAVISHAVTKGLNPNAPMKDSGVEWLGQVPEHWCVFRLKHLAAQMKAGPFGSSLTKDMYVSSGYKIYGQEQVIPGDFSIGDYYISEDKYAELRQYAVKAGDILISCVGTFGKIAVFPKDAQEGVINPRLIKVSPTEVILPEFLELVLRSQVAFEQMTLFSRGGTMDVVNIGILSEIRVTVPPILEQKSLLSEVNIRVEQYDHLVNKAENTISLLKERRTALISAAVTGKIDLRGWTPPADEVAA